MSERDDAGAVGEVPPAAVGVAADEAVDRRRAVQRWWWVGGVVVAALIGVLTAFVLAGGDDAASDPAASSATGGGSTGSVVSSEPSASTSVGGPGSSDPATGGTATGGTATGGSGAPSTDVSSGSSAPPVVTPPVVTVPVVTGSLDTVVVDTVVPAPAVAIDEPADTGAGMSFRLERVEAVQGEAAGPGEIAAPAVRVTVAATNEGTQDVLLETVVVDLRFGPQLSSAAPLSGPGAQRFAGVLAPGATATGVYVFDVPVDQRGEVSVFVSYLASVPPVVFQGPVPTA